MSYPVSIPGSGSNRAPLLEREVRPISDLSYSSSLSSSSSRTEFDNAARQSVLEVLPV